MKSDAKHQEINKTTAEHTKMVELIEEAQELSSSHPEIAIEKIKQAIYMARKLKDYSCLAKSQSIMGVCQITIGKYKDAIQILEDNLKFVRQHIPDNVESLSRAYSHLGIAYLQTGEYKTALDTLLIARSFSYQPLLPSIYNNLGVIYSRIKNHDKALEYWKIGLSMLDEKEEVRRYARTIYNIASSYFALGRVEEAKQGIEKVLELFEQTKEKEHTVAGSTHIYSLNMLSKIYCHEKNYSAALQVSEYSLNLAEAQHLTPICCKILVDKANLHFEQADEESGITCLFASLAYANKDDLHGHRQETLEQIIDYYKKTGNFDAAFPYLEQLYEILKKESEELRDKNFKKIIAEREEEIHLLEEKNKEIAEHNGILEQFAYVISHDLREPVRGITGFTSLLEKKYRNLLDEKGKDYINFILSETNSINNNLARLLEYTTFKKPQADEIQRIYLPEIIAQEQQKHTNLPCKLNISGKDIYLKMKPHHVRTLFHELVKNAIQFRKKEEDCHIEIHGEFKDGAEYIVVKDYGIGIEEQYQKKVFRIFNQLNKLDSKGAGVGLAICERIVGLYKGRIWIESIPNEFTIFHISIPA